MSPQPRKDEVAQERRRRQDGTLDRNQQMKLDIPESARAKYPDHQFRWVNDTGTRIHDLTVRDDYDKVEGVEPRPVGTDDQGKPIYAHLCAKRREFFDEDQRRRIDANRERENALLKAPDPDSAREAPEVYAQRGNSITPGYTP